MTCPAGTYSTTQGDGAAAILRCVSCDTSCQYGCSAAGSSACTSPTTGVNPCVSFQLSSSLAVSPGACVSVCPDGTYPNANNVCEPCDTSLCSRCSAPGVANCSPGSCATTGQNGQCVASCDTTREYRTGIAGQYTCSQCHAQCATTGALTGCTGAGSTACRACAYAQYDGECFATCPGYFENGACVTRCTSSPAVSVYVDQNRVCQPCHAQCLNCK
jgi:proprotein convertase subtilisin/kexin type 5